MTRTLPVVIENDPVSLPKADGWIGPAMIVSSALLLLVCGAGIVLRARGMSISLWMDEAWVANSLLTPSLREMFYYQTWLQTTPPGFLLLARGTVKIFGLSPFILRAVPLFSGILGLLAFAVLATRVLRPPFSLIAVATVAFSPTAVIYASTLKQYSTELMVGALLLLAAWQFWNRPSGRSYALLLVTAVGGLVCAYGALFEVGGVVLLMTASLVWPGDGPATERRQAARRLAILIAVVTATLAIEYIWFYLPNSSPELRRFWATTAVERPTENPIQQLFRHLVVFARHSPLAGPLTSRAVIGGVSVVFVGLAWAVTRRKWSSDVTWVLCTSLLPVVALLASTWLELYPNSPRTSLVLVPGLALLVARSCQWCHSLLTSWTERAVAGSVSTALSWTIWCSLTGILLLAGGRALLTPIGPYEDYRSAVAYMGDHVADDDLVYVHACCDEGFRLYRTLAPWPHNPAVVVGLTGQPCCRPNRPVIQEPKDAIKADVIGRLPHAFKGRVWLFYTDRFDYWTYSSLQQEGPVLVEALEERGCIVTQRESFEKMSVAMADCASR